MRSTLTTETHNQRLQSQLIAKQSPAPRRETGLAPLSQWSERPPEFQLQSHVGSLTIPQRS
jgi:hypothetical protein